MTDVIRLPKPRLAYCLLDKYIYVYIYYYIILYIKIVYKIISDVILN